MTSDTYFRYERVTQYLKISQCNTPYRQTKKKKAWYQLTKEKHLTKLNYHS